MTQHALRTFRRVQQKLAILSFMDPRIGPILDQVERFLRHVPSRGPITGSVFQEGFGVWMLLCDEDRMARHGAGMLHHEDVEVETEVDAEVESETEVEAEAEAEAEVGIAKRLDVNLDASDRFEDVDAEAADETEQTPFAGVFEEAEAMLELEANAVAEAKTIPDFGWF